MTSIYNTLPHSANAAALREASVMLNGTIGLLQAIARKHSGPVGAALAVLVSRLSLYQQAVEIVSDHIDHPDLMVSDILMPTRLRQSVMYEFRQAKDKADIGNLLETYVTISIECATRALRDISDMEQEDSSMYEAMRWLEAACSMLDDAADATYQTWNTAKAA